MNVLCITTTSRELEYARLGVRGRKTSILTERPVHHDQRLLLDLQHSIGFQIEGTIGMTCPTAKPLVTGEAHRRVIGKAEAFPLLQVSGTRNRR